MENLTERSREELIDEIDNLKEDVKKRDKYSKYEKTSLKHSLIGS